MALIHFKNFEMLDPEFGELQGGHELLVEGDTIKEVSSKPIKSAKADVTRSAPTSRAIESGLPPAIHARRRPSTPRTPNSRRWPRVPATRTREPASWATLRCTARSSQPGKRQSVLRPHPRKRLCEGVPRPERIATAFCRMPSNRNRPGV